MTALLDQLTAWDYLVALVALVSVGLGMLRGMARTVADLASWLLAFLAAPVLGAQLAPLLGLHDYRPLVITLAFVLVFFLVRLLGVAIARGLNAIGLAGADRALGGLVGVARAVLVVAVLATGARMIDLHREPAWVNALSRPVLDVLSDLLRVYVPDLPGLGPRALGRRTMFVVAQSGVPPGRHVLTPGLC